MSYRALEVGRTLKAMSVSNVGDRYLVTSYVDPDSVPPVRFGQQACGWSTARDTQREFTTNLFGDSRKIVMRLPVSHEDGDGPRNRIGDEQFLSVSLLDEPWRQPAPDAFPNSPHERPICQSLRIQSAPPNGQCLITDRKSGQLVSPQIGGVPGR